MPGEVALDHELRNDGLLQPRGAGVEGLARRGEPLDQTLGYDQIAKPQSREQHLAEAAGVEHDILAVEAFQRRQWSAGVMKLAVVVVFDDPSLRACGPSQQCQSPRQR